MRKEKSTLHRLIFAALSQLLVICTSCQKMFERASIDVIMLKMQIHTLTVYLYPRLSVSFFFSRVVPLSSMVNVTVLDTGNSTGGSSSIDLK